MSLLARLRKLSSVSAALDKSAGWKTTALEVGAPVAGGAVLMAAPGVATKAYKTSKNKFSPETHKAELGLEQK